MKRKSSTFSHERKDEDINAVPKKRKKLPLNRLRLNKKLLDAVKNNNTRKVDYLLMKGANVNSTDDLKSVLHYAVENNNAVIVALLINYGAKICAKDHKFYIPLHSAIDNKNIEIIRILLIYGVGINETFVSNQTPLHKAIILGAEEQLIYLLLKKGANVHAKNLQKETPLVCAINTRNVNVIRLLIKWGADVNARCTRNKTPLHFAINYIEIVQELIEAGADVNAMDDFGNTVLHYCLLTDNIELCVWLLENGANADIKNKNGCSSLVRAIVARKIDFVGMILAHKILKSVQNSRLRGEFNVLENFICNMNADVTKIFARFNGDFCFNEVAKYFPLQLALDHKEDILRLLLDFGAKVNCYIGQTLLLNYLCRFGYRNFIWLFLKYNAITSIRDEYGKAPLHIACIAKDFKTAKLLIEHGANVNFRDKDSHSSLHHAVLQGSLKIVKLLINNGANINAQIKSTKFTPLRMSLSNHRSNITDFLLMHTIRLIGLRLYVNDMNIDLLETELNDERNTMIKYSRIEADLMRSTTIHKKSRITLYQFLTKPDKIVLNYLRNNELRESLKTWIFLGEYRDMFKHRLIRVLRKWELNERGHRTLRTILMPVCHLPVDCTLKILSYFHEHYIRYMIRTHNM